MDSENVNIHNEDYSTGSEIPTSIKQECHYFIKYIHPHGFKFQDIYNNCSNGTQLGLKSGGIRHRTGRYIKRALRNKAYTNSLRLGQVSSAEAPQASSALKRLKEIYPWRFQDQATMPFSHDYIDHDDEDGDDDDYVSLPQLVKNPPPAPGSLFLGVASRSASGRDLTCVPKPNSISGKPTSRLATRH
jgi:hypothetical protein